MTRPRSTGFIVLSAWLLLAAGCSAPIGTASAGPAAAASPVAGLPSARPEDVGMSSERLARLSTAMEQLVADKRLAGITTAVARHGKLASFGTFGHRDIEAGATMAPDTIFRIYSMSKPITGVALMILYEEGKFRLSDPVSRYIPEFANLQVAASSGPGPLRLEKLSHPITIRELMSHTAGFSYGLFSQSPVDAMYVEKRVLAYDGTLRDMITRLAGIPLRQQPGTMWHYSVAVDVQGYLVEVLSGQTFDQFLQERVFTPLGMNDTGFYVPKEKAGRFAQIYAYGKDRSLLPPSKFDESSRIGSAVIEPETVVDKYLKPPTFLSGGGGLVSTTSDYLRFAQMLLNGGELDGVRILSPLTVNLMRQNQLPRTVREMSPGVGFGLDFAVVDDPVAADGISRGEYYWGGAAGTWFWIDPAENLVFVGMIQQLGNDRPDVRSLSRRLTYQSIIEPAAEASSE
jgi:CubicO group peptidase (beta-lactamase class C family)